MADEAAELVPGWDRTRIAEAVSPLVDAELDAKRISERSVIGLMKLILDHEDGPTEGCFEVLEDHYGALLRRAAHAGFVLGFRAAADPQAWGGEPGAPP